VAENGTERYEHGWKRNGLRHGTGTGTVLFRARVLTVSCPAFRKFGTARHGMVKALDTARNDTGTRHGTERGDLYDEFKIAKYKVSLKQKALGGGMMKYKRLSMRRKNVTNVYITTRVMKTYRSTKQLEETQKM
jgi:hypothetical protein